MSSNSGWAYGLLKAIEETKNCVISNNELVVIKDKFPKAEFHFLVIPKQNISSIFELDTSKLKLLNEMYLMALNVIEVNGRKPDEFLIGYHANPSMLQLHLHVISTDFNSSFLKTKKHFNSFNTEFFISHENLVSSLTRNGKISKLPDSVAKDLLGTPLKCNKCEHQSKTMPALKDHLRIHARDR